MDEVKEQLIDMIAEYYDNQEPYTSYIESVMSECGVKTFDEMEMSELNVLLGVLKEMKNKKENEVK